MNWKEFDFNKTQKYIIDNDIKPEENFKVLLIEVYIKELD